jgi:hypothetical protein
VHLLNVLIYKLPESGMFFPEYHRFVGREFLVSPGVCVRLDADQPETKWFWWI